MNSLQVQAWSFWSPEAVHPANWRKFWLDGGQESEGNEIVADLIPSMHRRRMSNLSKMAVQAALTLSRNVKADYLVFSSRHGEMVRTQKLLASLADNVVLSPTDFSQSVHNTSSGLYTIIAGLGVAANSVAAGAASFAYAWCEAEGFLAENPDSKVLLVDCDDALPGEYSRFVSQTPCAYALGLLLTSAAGASLDIGLCDDSQEALLPIGPQFMDWWLSTDRRLEVCAEGQRFSWDRSVGA